MTTVLTIQQMTRYDALQQLIKAWTVAGVNAEHHAAMQMELHRKWPTLAQAVATLTAVMENTCDNCGCPKTGPGLAFADGTICAGLDGTMHSRPTRNNTWKLDRPGMPNEGKVLALLTLAELDALPDDAHLIGVDGSEWIAKDAKQDRETRFGHSGYGTPIVETGT